MAIDHGACVAVSISGTLKFQGDFLDAITVNFGSPSSPPSRRGSGRKWKAWAPKTGRWPTGQLSAQSEYINHGKIHHQWEKPWLIMVNNGESMDNIWIIDDISG